MQRVMGELCKKSNKYFPIVEFVKSRFASFRLGEKFLGETWVTFDQ